MSDQTDPFRHHPELRGLVKDPAQSFFRNFVPAEFDEIARAHGMREDWRYPDDVRDRLLNEFLADLPAGDLWVFAYGSLIWDPAAYFVELRKAYTPDFSRQFILVDDGARGTPAQPGVMAALDQGAGCEGVVFRLEAETLRTELEIIWRREQIAPAYVPVMNDFATAQGPVRALSFVANHDSRDIDATISFDRQVAALASASGVIGTNFEYIESLKRNLDTLGIRDDHVDDLFAAAKLRRDNDSKSH